MRTSEDVVSTDCECTTTRYNTPLSVRKDSLMFKCDRFVVVVLVSITSLKAAAQIPEHIRNFVVKALATGDTERGISVFGSVKTACVSCREGAALALGFTIFIEL